MTTKGQRALRGVRPPRLPRGGTITARGATFQSLTHHPGTALVSPLAKNAIFGSAWQPKYARYDTEAQGWLARALREPKIAAKANGHTIGTGPELVVCGYFLAHGYEEGRDLFFQDYKFVINERSRTRIKKLFVVDVAVNDHFGGTIFLNIDGAQFHTKTALQEFRDAVRDGTLKKRGRVVDVPDTVCYAGQTLVDFLIRAGITV